MKKVYNNPVTEIMGLEVEAYLCQASSQHPSLTITQSTQGDEPAY